jgi:hypothetical protein
MRAKCLFKQRARTGSSLHKKARRASLGFRTVEGALRTIQGEEAMNNFRKGQIRWLAEGDVVEQMRFIN